MKQITLSTQINMIKQFENNVIEHSLIIFSAYKVDLIYEKGASN